MSRSIKVTAPDSRRWKIKRVRGAGKLYNITDGSVELTTFVIQPTAASWAANLNASEEDREAGWAEAKRLALVLSRYAGVLSAHGLLTDDLLNYLSPSPSSSQEEETR